MTKAAVVLSMLLATSSTGLADDRPKKEPLIIGDAVMEADGTIIMNLRRTRDGATASAQLRYTLTDPQYRDVLDHLGGMRPGETKLVPAWDDPAPPKK